MTSATNPTRRSRAGFTLLELLLVVGIIGLLAAILLPAVTRTWDRAIRIRTQADLSAIATALEAYKNDFHYYPPITVANSGAAVLGKALLGPADAAHFYTVAPPDLFAIPAATALPNAPDAFVTGKTYQAGDVVLNGAAPKFADFIAGRQSAGTPVWNIFVCVRNETNGAAHSPTGAATDFWWTPFLPYDGADGAGVRERLTAATFDSTGTDTGVPHAAAGKVYGPYLDVDRFKTNGPVILDRHGSPILYFPTNKAAVPANAGAFVNQFDYPRNTATQTLSFVNANDNLGAFAFEGPPLDTVVKCVAKIRLMLGDYNTNGANDAGEPTPPTVPYLLWTAGADRIFGPRGENAVSTDAAVNATNAAAADDVTNFR